MTRLALAGPEEAASHAIEGHPERPSRVSAAMEGVDDLGLGDDLVRLPAREADAPDLTLVHSAAYLRQLESFCERGGGQLDPDTFAGPDSWSAARRAAGAGLAAVEALASDQADVAFVAARPPGHHALADRAMGFCLINNVAVAAARLAAADERVLIVDWDVHHGNGTQAIFWDDPRVLYVSTHQAPFYPGTGRAQELGGPAARRLTVNIPLPAGATGDVVRRALDEVAAPAVDGFGPSWVLVSAGYDAHRDDPLADLALSSGDFADLARLVAGFAPSPGRLVLFLEGGYNLTAIRRSVRASLASLLGGRDQAEPPTSGGPGIEAVASARRAQAEPVEGELW
jgi:acetoin utilization deacetylase AcuC-like enzyme